MEAWSALLLALLVCLCRSASAGYQNFTVGDEEGWTDKPSLSYSKWASNKTFTLGDFLIFNFTNSSYDVILTYNKTLYGTCDYIDGSGDFQVWGESPTTMSTAIPLVQTGPTYFFCGFHDGELCKDGMQLSINVTEGDGLPPSLAIPPPAPSNGTAPPPPSDSSGDFDGGNYGNENGASYKHDSIISFVLAFLILFVLVPNVIC